MKRMSLVTLVLAIVIACGSSQAAPKPSLSGDLNAQESAKPSGPQLSEAVKLELRNAALYAENLQLKAQALAAEFNRAQQSFQALIAKHTPEGYQIDNNLNLVKIPEKK